MEAEDLGRAREMVQMILRDWDWLTWNDLLADDVVLSLRLGAGNKAGAFGAAGGILQATGRDDPKSALKTIYSDLKNELSVTTEIVSGYDAVLLGNFSRQSCRLARGDHSVPAFGGKLL
jgi:hypothetical protein